MKELTQTEAKQWLTQNWNRLNGQQLSKALAAYFKKYGKKSLADEAKVIFAK